MADRIPPHNSEAERSALGAAMLSKDALGDIVEILSENDFYVGANKEIFSCMVSLYEENKPVDLVTVSEELERRKVLETVGGRSYVAELSGSVPAAINGAEYANIVREKAQMRRLILAAEGIREKAFSEDSDAVDIVDYAEKEIFKVGQDKKDKNYSELRDVLKKNIDIIDQAVKNKGKLTGIKTGFRELDDATNGLQPADLIIIGARPSMGKTAFALNIAQNAALKDNASVMIFSLEMPETHLGQRLLATESKIEMENLKKGRLERKDWDRLNMAMEKLSSSDVVIDDTPGLTVATMKNKCRRRKASSGLDLVIVDYLQLMEGEGKSENRQTFISETSRHLKLLAREIECPVIALSQLSRGPSQQGRSDHKPVLSDLRDSGAIEQDADVVLLLHRDDYYNRENSKKPGICEINIAKNRNGPTKTFDLTWVERYTLFSDVIKEK